MKGLFIVVIMSYTTISMHIKCLYSRIDIDRHK